MNKRMKMMIVGMGFCFTGCPIWGGCLARGTKVATPRGPRPIEDLVAGDSMFSVNEVTGELVETIVTNVQAIRREVGAITIGGSTVHVTSDHPIYDPETGEYHPAGDWFLGERESLFLCGQPGFEVAAPDHVQVFAKIEDVFDISVASDHHNFIANGILVHNKSPIEETCEAEDGVVYEYGEQCDLQGCANHAFINCIEDGLAVCECDLPPQGDMGLNMDLGRRDMDSDSGAQSD